MSSPSGKRSFLGKAEAKKPCYRCGKSGHAPEKCYHKEKMCNVCKKKGHIASVCRSSKQKQRNTDTKKGQGQSKMHHVQDDDEELEEYALYTLNVDKVNSWRVAPLIDGDEYQWKSIPVQL